MKYFAGLDVSVKETSICIVGETGKICSELKVSSQPEDLLRACLSYLVEARGASAGALR